MECKSGFAIKIIQKFLGTCDFIPIKPRSKRFANLLWPIFWLAHLPSFLPQVCFSLSFSSLSSYVHFDLILPCLLCFNLFFIDLILLSLCFWILADFLSWLLVVLIRKLSEFALLLRLRIGFI